MRTTSLWIMLSTLVLSGCGQVKSSEVSNAGSAGTFLVAADIVAGTNLNSPTSKDMLNSLAGNGILYNNQATSTSACDKVIQDIPITATATALTIAATVDTSACMTTMFTTSTTTVTTVKGSLQVYLQVTCQGGGDLSSYNGKTYGTILTGSPKPDEVCTTSTEIIETASQLSATLQSGNNTYQITVHDATFDGKSDLTPCTVTSTGANGKYTVGNDCISTSKADSTAVAGTKTTNSEDYSKFTFTNVVDDVNATALWHASGTIGVTYDNWTGTLTYTGAAVAPKYQMTPTGGQAITGSLSASTLALNRHMAARLQKMLF